MRHALFAVATVVAVSACDVAASAPTGPATPATLKAHLDAAKGGETIRLAPGDYGVVTFPRRTYSPAITLDASQASFAGLVLMNTGGVTVRGGRIDGPGGRSYGISIRGADGVRIENMRISGAHRGVVVNESENVALVGNELTGLISDGINVALSRKVLVQRNRCHDFSPRMAIFDADGKKLKDGDHPDCIQAWSRPSRPPVSDVQVLDNVMEGKMQGIFFGNHVRNGIDDGGFDRVLIKGNRLKVNMLGITLDNARDSRVEDNHVERWPELVFPDRPNFRVKSGVRINGGTATGCGNVVQAGGPVSGSARCPSPRS
jgi:nitrous oxidase accessory protein NosD